MLKTLYLIPKPQLSSNWKKKTVTMTVKDMIKKLKVSNLNKIVDDKKAKVNFIRPISSTKMD